MKFLITLLAFGLLASGLPTKSYASVAPISKKIICSTPRGLKAFSINKKTITYIKEKNWVASRAIAQVQTVRSRRSGQGVTKIFKFEGQKHIIHINNLKNFNEVDDYLIVKNRNGHEMTWPLSCQFK